MSAREREPRTAPPPAYRDCLCDWVLQDHGQHVAPVRVKSHPGCLADHRSGGGRLVPRTD